jgi:16S rRNA C967 or C1407 C5-methylase (RsmB/RsmF family)
MPKSGKLFDAIICDVPCGGDGTIRKDKHILPMWSPNISNSIHSLQLKILLRALELVRVGGVVCYSTCSLNPIEDEAVVSAALGKGENDGKFEILEWPEDMLPGFIGRAGVFDWKVAFYDSNNVDQDEDDFGSLSFYESYEAAVSAGMEDAKSTFWPNTTENKCMRLERCMRLVPQDQDTGGFFISLIKKIG